MIVKTIPRRFASRNDTKHIISKVSINQKGFTLLEIIVSITVMTIIAVIAGNGLIEIAKGYTFSRKNAQTAQQGQIVMARLKKEISNIKTVTSTPTATSISFTRNSDGSSHTISWSVTNSLLQIDGDTLIGPVSFFSLAYYDSYSSSAPSYSSSTSIIEITLQLTGAEDATIEFIDRVNLYLETGG
ncbi:MAG: prepilin-type N-terminal cleavage/methylation domain-containing protein [Syntrophaceae bacterium]